MSNLKFQSFGSGSSGNCYFVGTDTFGILIDAGIGIRTIRKNLKSLGFDFHNIWGAFITHDHADHIKAVGPLGEKHLVPIYTTRKVHEGIQRSYCVTEKLYSSRKHIEKNESVTIADFKVTAFAVSHDSTDCVGYTVEYKQKKITFVTDIGFIGEEVAYHISQADYLILEANYDSNMLQNGPYPERLKQRISADTGHLGNHQAADFLAKNYHNKLKYIFLCHLSKENNDPNVAYSTVKAGLEKAGVDVEKDINLITLNRTELSELYEL